MKVSRACAIPDGRTDGTHSRREGGEGGAHGERGRRSFDALTALILAKWREIDAACDEMRRDASKAKKKPAVTFIVSVSRLSAVQTNCNMSMVRPFVYLYACMEVVNVKKADYKG